MWAYLVAVVLVIVGLVGSISGAGIFTIILIPIGIVVAVGAFVAAAMGRSAAGRAGGETHASSTTDAALPHKPQRPPSHVPTSPEGLADARRAQQ